MSKKLDPKAVANEFSKVDRHCRGQRPKTIEPGTSLASRLEKRHGIKVVKTLDVDAELSRLFAAKDQKGAARFDKAVRQEWCQVELGRPKCGENISKVAAKAIENGAGLDGLEFEVTCPSCGCVSRHSIAVAG